jgi:hypothetical protein
MAPRLYGLWRYLLCGYCDGSPDSEEWSVSKSNTMADDKEEGEGGEEEDGEAEEGEAEVGEAEEGEADENGKEERKGGEAGIAALCV